MSKEFIDSGGNAHLLIDPDTIVDTDGKRRRLDGFNGFETPKLIKK